MGIKSEYWRDGLGCLHHCYIDDGIKKEKEATMQNEIDVVPFGIPVLDEKVGGIHKGSITLLRASVGGYKTAIVTQIAGNAAYAGHKVR